MKITRKKEKLSSLKHPIQQNQQISSCNSLHKENILSHTHLPTLEHNVPIQEQQLHLNQKAEANNSLQDIVKQNDKIFKCSSSYKLKPPSDIDKEYFPPSSLSSCSIDSASSFSSDKVTYDAIKAEQIGADSFNKSSSPLLVFNDYARKPNQFQGTNSKVSPNFSRETSEKYDPIQCVNSFKPSVAAVSSANESEYHRLPFRKTRGINKRKHNQILKNLGLEYTSTRCKVVNARSMGRPCGIICRLKCKERICENDRRNIFDSYWGLGSLSLQRDFIARSMTVINPEYQYKNNERQANNSYHFLVKGERTRVCKTFFKSTLGISNTSIKTSQKKQIAPGVIAPDKRGKHENSNNKFSEDKKSY